MGHLEQLSWYINCLEMLPFFLALSYFRTDIWNCRVMRFFLLSSALLGVDTMAHAWLPRSKDTLVHVSTVSASLLVTRTLWILKADSKSLVLILLNPSAVQSTIRSFCPHSYYCSWILPFLHIHYITGAPYTAPWFLLPLVCWQHITLVTGGIIFLIPSAGLQTHLFHEHLTTFDFCGFTSDAIYRSVFGRYLCGSRLGLFAHLNYAVICKRQNGSIGAPQRHW